MDDDQALVTIATVTVPAGSPQFLKSTIAFGGGKPGEVIKLEGSHDGVHFFPLDSGLPEVGDTGS